MADKYLQNQSGTIAEKEATVQSMGSADAGKIPALDPNGKLDPSLIPSGAGDMTSIQRNWFGA